MKVFVKITEKEIKELIIEKLHDELGQNFSGDINDVRIEVKSKQNYRSEWEVSDFRAIYERNT